MTMAAAATPLHDVVLGPAAAVLLLGAAVLLGRPAVLARRPAVPAPTAESARSVALICGAVLTAGAGVLHLSHAAAHASDGAALAALGAAQVAVSAAAVLLRRGGVGAATAVNAVALVSILLARPAGALALIVGVFQIAAIGALALAASSRPWHAAPVRLAAHISFAPVVGITIVTTLVLIAAAAGGRAPQVHPHL